MRKETSVMVRVPLEIKKRLQERAEGRPLWKMLQQDFLHEPDMQKVLELKIDGATEQLRAEFESRFQAFQVELGGRLDSIFKKNQSILLKHQALITDLLRHEKQFNEVLGSLRGELKNIDTNFKQQHEANLEVGRRLATLEGDKDGRE